MLKYFVISIESFRKGEIPPEAKLFLHTYPEAHIVLDESAKIKTSNPCKLSNKSKQTQGILKLNQYGSSRGILTGTFMTKSPCDAYDQANFVKPGFFGMSMSDFADYYTVRINLPIGRGRRVIISPEDYTRIYNKLTKAASRGPAYFQVAMNQENKNNGMLPDDIQWIMQHPSYTPFKRIDELWSKIKEVFSVVKKKDCLDLPPISYQRIRVSLSESAKKAYKLLVDNGFNETTVAPNPMSLFYRLQDICNGYTVTTHEDKTVTYELTNSEKLDALSEYIDTIDTVKDQVVVWSVRPLLLHDAEKMLTAAGYSVSLVDGNTDKKELPAIKDKFLSGVTRIMLMNPSVGGTGVDYLGGANYAVYLCSDYSLDKWIQSRDRIDRMRSIEKRAEHKTICTISCAGTVDEKVMENLKIGLQLLDAGTTDKAVFDLYDPDKLIYKDGSVCVF